MKYSFTENVQYKLLKYLFLCRDCRTSNKIWFWMDEFGNPLKNPSLEQEDLEKLIK